MSAGEKYLWAAYLVVLATVLVYIAIIGAKLGRLDRDLAELTELARAQEAEREQSREEARVG